MTTTVNDATPILSILADLASTDATFQNAAEAFAVAIGKARDAGIKSGDLDGRPKGKWFVETQTAVATARLNPEELALWSDKSKAPVGSPKHKLAVRVNSAVGRIRTRLAELEASAMTQAIEPETAKGAETAKGTKGTKGARASFIDLQADDLTRLYKRAEKDEGLHAEFQTALIRAADLLQLVWGNEKFAPKK